DSLLLHILQRLPNPRSVSVCRSVCKHWEALISSPNTLRHLISRQKLNLTNNGGERPLLIYFDRPETHFESIVRSNVPPIFLSDDMVQNVDRHTIQVISCCYDLLLLGRVRPKNRYRRRFFVCNPFTKQYVILPLVPRNLAKFQGFYFGTHRQQYSECDASLIGFVCEPCFTEDLSCSSSSSDSVVRYNLEFRFRVVFISTGEHCLGVTAFSSETWEWTFRSFGRHMTVHDELPLVPSTAPYIGIGNACSTAKNKLFWKTSEARVAVYDPFSKQSPPKIDLVDCSHLWSDDIVNNNFLVGVSQGFLRGMVFPRPDRPDYNKEGFFSLWKLEEDRDLVGGYRWSLDYQVSMRVLYNMIIRRHKMNKIEEGGGRKRTRRRRRRMTRLGVLGVHPSRPEVVYFECRDYAKKHNHDPFFFDFNHHFRDDDGGTKLRDDRVYDPIYVVPFDVLKLEVAGEVIPIAESDATHLKFKHWGKVGRGDPMGWAVFQPLIPFWPTPIPVPDFANGLIEEEPEEAIREDSWITDICFYNLW
ncbi:unnamed protein product, partial [Linum tenue]